MPIQCVTDDQCEQEDLNSSIRQFPKIFTPMTSSLRSSQRDENNLGESVVELVETLS